MTLNGTLQLTYADLAVVFLFEGTKENFGVEVPLDKAKFPKLAALKAKVEAEPGLADWLKKRPAPIPPPQ
jgi:glutathione S-transferase